MGKCLHYSKISGEIFSPDDIHVGNSTELLIELRDTLINVRRQKPGEPIFYEYDIDHKDVCKFEWASQKRCGCNFNHPIVNPSELIQWGRKRLSQTLENTEACIKSGLIDEQTGVEQLENAWYFAELCFNLAKDIKNNNCWDVIIEAL